MSSQPSDMELDPRWEWHLIQRLGMADEYLRGRCLHTEIIPVESSVTGHVVAQLCRTCDTQFPAPADRRIGTVHTD